MEQQRIAGLEQQLHHAETAALAAETRVPQLDARERSSRNQPEEHQEASFDGQPTRFLNLRFQFVAYCHGC